jgi:hypothetical protein
MPALPRRSHIDVHLLARSALGVPQRSDRRLSLGLVAELLLGLPLDKTQQQSDWAARPLNEEQVHRQKGGGGLASSINCGMPFLSRKPSRR